MSEAGGATGLAWAERQNCIALGQPLTGTTPIGLALGQVA
jgi:hypothetical protein